MFIVGVLIARCWIIFATTEYVPTVNYNFIKNSVMKGNLNSEKI